MNVRIQNDNDLHVLIDQLFAEHMGITCELIGRQYIEFSNQHNFKSELSPGLHKAWSQFDPLKLQGFEGIELYNKQWFGIDIPVWLTSDGKGKKRLMIVAMDPLRNRNPKVNPKTITLNTPFTIHDKTVKNNYNDHIRNLASEYDIYLTDIYKLFYRDSINYKSMSNTDPKFQKSPIHEKMLKVEIEKFNPNFILCMGNKALKALGILGNFKVKPITSTPLSIQRETYRFESIPIFAIPHASGAARGGVNDFMKLHNSYHNKIHTNYLSEVVKLVEQHV